MRVLLLLTALCLTGCQLGTEADRATFDAVAVEYLSYVNQDPALTDRQKERRRETIRSWEAKVKRDDPDAPAPLPGSDREAQHDAVPTHDCRPPISVHDGPCDWGSGPCGCGTPGCSMPCSGCCDALGGCWSNPGARTKGVGHGGS